MARLPTPVVENIIAICPEDWALREKNFYSILGQAVRKGVVVDRIKDKEVEEKKGSNNNQSD